MRESDTLETRTEKTMDAEKLNMLGDAYLNVRRELARRGLILRILMEEFPEGLMRASSLANSIFKDRLQSEMMPRDSIPDELKWSSVESHKKGESNE